MSVVDWMIEPYRRYADFSGRARRREYWLFALFYATISALIVGLFGTPMRETWPFGFHYAIWLAPGGAGSWIGTGFALVSLIPALAVQVRRLHDVDRSGWWLLAWFFPFFGWTVLFVFFCLDGTRGGNSYGFDPKGRAGPLA